MLNLKASMVSALFLSFFALGCQQDPASGGSDAQSAASKPASTQNLSPEVKAHALKLKDPDLKVQYSAIVSLAALNSPESKQVIEANKTLIVASLNKAIDSLDEGYLDEVVTSSGALESNTALSLDASKKDWAGRPVNFRPILCDIPVLNTIAKVLQRCNQK